MLKKIAKLINEDSRNLKRVYIIGPVKSDTGRTDVLRPVTKALLSFEHKPPSQPVATRPRKRLHVERHKPPKRYTAHKGHKLGYEEKALYAGWYDALR